MKNNITIEQLKMLNTESILTLSNKEEIGTVWKEWDTVEKIDNALAVLSEKGWKHHTLIDTVNQCNVANFIGILNKLGKLSIHNDDESLNKAWSVTLITKEDNELNQYEQPELVDALWEAVVNHSLSNTRKITYKVIKTIENGYETSADVGDILTVGLWGSKFKKFPTLMKDGKAVTDEHSPTANDCCVKITE